MAMAVCSTMRATANVQRQQARTFGQPVLAVARPTSQRVAPRAAKKEMALNSTIAPGRSLHASSEV